jgi:hypothetical protein
MGCDRSRIPFVPIQFGSSYPMSSDHVAEKMGSSEAVDQHQVAADLVDLRICQPGLVR